MGVNTDFLKLLHTKYERRIIMDRLYTESFTIPAGGWTGGANAIMAAITGTTAITVNVRLWRDDPTTPVRQIALRPGQILPLKVRYVSHSSTVTGFN
jgi:hypothetical protein